MKSSFFKKHVLLLKFTTENINDNSVYHEINLLVDPLICYNVATLHNSLSD